MYVTKTSSYIYFDFCSKNVLTTLFSDNFLLLAIQKMFFYSIDLNPGLALKPSISTYSKPRTQCNQNKTFEKPRTKCRTRH